MTFTFTADLLLELVQNITNKKGIITLPKTKYEHLISIAELYLSEMRVGGAVNLQTIIMFFLHQYIDVIEELQTDISDYLSSRLITQIASLPLT